MIFSNRRSGFGVGLLLLTVAALSMPAPAEAQCQVTAAPSLFDPSPAAWNARPNSNFAPLPTSIAVANAGATKRIVTRWNYGFAVYNIADPAHPTFSFLKDLMSEGYPKNGDGSDRTGDIASSTDGNRVVVPWTDDAGYGTVVEVSNGGSYGTAGDYEGHVALMAPSQTAVLTYGSRYLGFTLSAGVLVVADLTSASKISGAGTPGSINAENVPGVTPRRFGGMVSAQGAGKSFLVINALTEIIVVDVTTPGPAGATLASSFVAASLPPSAFFPTGTTVPTKISTVAAAVHPVDHMLYVAVEGGSTTSEGIALGRFEEATATLTRRGFYKPLAPMNGLTTAAAMLPWDSDVVAFFVSKGTTDKKLRALAGADFSQDLAPNGLLPLAMPTGVLTALRGTGTKLYLYSGDANEAWAGTIDCTLSSAGAIPTLSVEKVPKIGTPVALASGATVYVGDELNIKPTFTSTLPLTSWRLDADLHASEKTAASPYLSWPDLFGGGADVPPTSLKVVGPCDPRASAGQPLEPVPTDWSWCWTTLTSNDAQGGPDFGAAAPAGTEKILQVGFEVANQDNVDGTNGIPESSLATFDLKWRIPAVRAKAESILAGESLADGSEGTPDTSAGWEWYFATAPGGGVLAQDPACTGPTCPHVFPNNGTYSYHMKVPYRGGYSSPDCGKSGTDCVSPPAGVTAFRTITLADVALAFTVPANVYRSEGVIKAQSASRKGAVAGSFTYQICQSPCAAVPTAQAGTPTGDPFAATAPGSLSLPMPATDGTYRVRINYAYTGTPACTTQAPCTVSWPTPSDDTTTWASVTVSPVEPYIILGGAATNQFGQYYIYVGDTGKAYAYVGDAQDPNPPSGLSWNFGNGQTGTTQGATFKYTTAGTYTITLNGYGPAQSISIVVDPKPTGGGGGGGGGGGSSTTPPTVKSVGANPSNPSPGQSVTLTCGATQGTYPITSYNFTFGDGAASATTPTNTTTHTWATAGEYSVSCRAKDSQNTFSAARTISLQVGAPVGACDFEIRNDSGTKISFDPTTGVYDATAGQPLTFVASGATGSITWDFGNGGAASGNPVTYTYPEASGASPFVATLTSLSCTRSYEVYVSAASGPAAITFKVLDDPSGAELAKSGANYEASSGQRLRFVSTNATGTVSWTFGDGTTSSDAQPVKWFEPLTDTTYVVTLGANGQTKQRSIAVKGSTGAPLTATYNFVYTDGTAVSRTGVQPNKAIRFTAVDQATIPTSGTSATAPPSRWARRTSTPSRGGHLRGAADDRRAPRRHAGDDAGAARLHGPRAPRPAALGRRWHGLRRRQQRGALPVGPLDLNPGTQTATVSLAFVSGAGWDGVTNVRVAHAGRRAGRDARLLERPLLLLRSRQGIVGRRPRQGRLGSRHSRHREPDLQRRESPDSGTFGLSVPAMSVAAGVRPQSACGGELPRRPSPRRDLPHEPHGREPQGRDGRGRDRLP